MYLDWTSRVVVGPGSWLNSWSSTTTCGPRQGTRRLRNCYAWAECVKSSAGTSVQYVKCWFRIPSCRNFCPRTSLSMQNLKSSSRSNLRYPETSDLWCILQKTLTLGFNKVGNPVPRRQRTTTYTQNAASATVLPQDANKFIQPSRTSKRIRKRMSVQNIQKEKHGHLNPRARKIGNRLLQCGSGAIQIWILKETLLMPVWKIWMVKDTVLWKGSYIRRKLTK